MTDHSKPRKVLISCCYALSLMIMTLTWAPAGAAETASLRLDLSQGAITSLANLLTGETYTRQVEAAGVESTLRYMAPGPNLREARAGEEGTSLEAQVTTEGSDLLVQQLGERAEGGVAGLWLGLGPIEAAQTRLLIPGAGGVELDADSKVADVSYYYPGSWGATALIIQGQKGGVLVSADESGSAFAALRITRLKTAWRISLLTTADAPWEDRTECASLKWRFTAYQGDWLVAANLQKAKLRDAFDLTPIAKRQPEWARHIRCIVKISGTGDFETPLRDLAAQVEPSKTLLYLPHWRTHPYDVMYPDYTPNEWAISFIEYAHELGFKVMAHGNLVGISPQHPRVEEFRDAIERDPTNHKEAGWYLDRESPSQIYCLNPAFAKVRKLIVDSFVASHEVAGFDALHLDFPLILTSDTGPIEGRNPIQGATQLLRELQAALPQVPLGTEGISDYMLDCWWAQFGEPFWNNNEAMGRYHPVRSAIFTDFCNGYGHLGFPDQQTDLQAFFNFTEAQDRTGCLPTFCLDLNQGLKLDSPGTRYALRQAKFFLENEPVPDYETVIEPVAAEGDTPRVPYFAWQLADGRSLALVQTDEGRKWIERAPGGQWRELWRIYQGVSEMDAPVHIPGWLAFSGQRSFGLDPTAIYMPEEGAPDESGFHVTSVSDPVRVSLGSSDARRDVVRLEPLQSNILDLTVIRPDVTGIIVEGEELPMGKGGTFAIDSFFTGSLALKGILEHPPYELPSIQAGEYSPDFRPATFGEYLLKLPDMEGLCFQTKIGLRDLPMPGTPNGDGATFRVLVDGVEVFQRHWDQRRAEPVEVDLSPWRGKELRLRLVTDVGPNGNPSFDWALWAEPRIALKAPAQSTIVELAQPRREGVLIVADSYGSRLLEPSTPSVQVSLPASIIYARELAEVTGPGLLVDLPYFTGLGSGSVIQPGTVFGSGAPSGWRGATPELKGINAHTPSWGQTHLEWLLRLPEEPLKLAFGAAIQPGGEQVAFRVLINGQVAWDGGDPGSGKLRESSVDLSSLAGQVVLISLVTDSLGSNNCDWAIWVNPRLEPAR